MQLGQIMKEALETAKAKGFRDEERSFPADIALMHSELSEALEAYRDPKRVITDIYRISDTDYQSKPEGVGVELADAIIRICESCEYHGIPLGYAIMAKLTYNKTRPHMHGGKRC